MFGGSFSFGGWGLKTGGFNKGWAKSDWTEKSWGQKKWAKKSWSDDKDDAAPVGSAWQRKLRDDDDGGSSFDFGGCKPVTFRCGDDDGPRNGWKKQAWQANDWKKDWADKQDWKKKCAVPEEPEVPEEEANAAPEITAPSGTFVGFLDNTAGASITDVDATDADGDTLVFSIIDTPASEDADIFLIDPAA